MAGFKVRQVDSALVGKLGFEKAETHHHVYRLWLDGRLAARTYISHGERELRDFHVSHMARQMHLQVAEFADVVTCPLSREEYYCILRQVDSAGRIPHDQRRWGTSLSPKPP